MTAPRLPALVSPPQLAEAGARARSAEGVLRHAGMRNLHPLQGGVLAWRARGLPVERPTATPALGLSLLPCTSVGACVDGRPADGAAHAA